VVFNEGIRRGLACGEHRRGPGRRVRRSFSTEQELRETSPDHEEGLSFKASVNVPSHIICHIKRRFISPKTSEQKQCHDVCLANSYTSANKASDDTFGRKFSLRIVFEILFVSSANPEDQV